MFRDRHMSVIAGYGVPVCFGSFRRTLFGSALILLAPPISVHFINDQMNVALGLTAMTHCRARHQRVFCTIKKKKNCWPSEQPRGTVWFASSAVVSETLAIPLRYSDCHTIFFSSPSLSEADRCLPAEHHNFTMLDRRVHVSDARVKEVWHTSINLTQESTHYLALSSLICATRIRPSLTIHANTHISNRINCYKLHIITYSRVRIYTHTHTRKTHARNIRKLHARNYKTRARAHGLTTKHEIRKQRLFN